MVNAYNLTVQLQLQSPKNVNQVLNDLRRQLKPIDADVRVKANASSVATLNKELSKTKKNVDASKQSMDSLNRAIQESARRFSVITLATGTFLGFASAVKNSVKEAVSFEKELIRIKQVTGDTNKGIKSLSDEVTRLATSIGASSSELLKAATTLAQAGFTAEQTRKSLDILAKTTLGATFGDIQETTEGVIAILNQFGKEAVASGKESQFLEKSLDALNSISKAFAVESSDLISAIRRTGGVFAATGGKVEELAAIFTSVRATTRESAETIATGLRTIFTRIQRTDTINQLKDLGIVLRESNGQFVGAFEAVKRLSEGLASLDPKDYRYSDIVEELGGFRQVGKVIPLIQQFRIAQEALSVAQRSSGSIAKDAELAQEGLGVKIDKVREKFDALIRKVSETSTFKNIAEAAISLSEAFIKVADSLAPLIPLIATLITFRLGKSIAPAIAGLAGIGRSPRGTGPVSRFARGGVVPGTGNSDTVPAMLTPGEFVIKKSSVKKLGVDTLRRMNENRYMAGTRGKGVKKNQEPEPDNVQVPASSKTAFAHVLPSIGKIEDEELKKLGITNLYTRAGIDVPETWNQAWNREKPDGQGVFRIRLIDYINKKRGKVLDTLVNDDKRYGLRSNSGVENETELRKLFTEDKIENQIASYLSRNLQRDAYDFYDTDPRDVYPHLGPIFVSSVKSVNKNLADFLQKYTSGKNKSGRKKLSSKEYEAVKLAGYNSGGSIDTGTDTVPSLLTPGEFVINKQAAQRIGYGNLNRMNKQGVARFAKGGAVGIQRFFRGGQAEKDVARGQGSALESINQAEQALAKILNDLPSAMQESFKKSFLGIEQVKEGRRQKAIPGLSAFNEATRGQAGFKSGKFSMGLQLQGRKVAATEETVAHETGHMADYILGGGKGFASATQGTFQFDIIEKIKPVMIKAFEKAGKSSEEIQRYLSSNVELFAEFFAKAQPEVRNVLASTTDSKLGMAKLAKTLEEIEFTYAGLELSDVEEFLPEKPKKKKPKIGKGLGGIVGEVVKVGSEDDPDWLKKLEKEDPQRAANLKKYREQASKLSPDQLNLSPDKINELNKGGANIKLPPDLSPAPQVAQVVQKAKAKKSEKLTVEEYLSLKGAKRAKAMVSGKAPSPEEIANYESGKSTAQPKPPQPATKATSKPAPKATPKPAAEVPPKPATKATPKQKTTTKKKAEDILPAVINKVESQIKQSAAKEIAKPTPAVAPKTKEQPKQAPSTAEVNKELEKNIKENKTQIQASTKQEEKLNETKKKLESAVVQQTKAIQQSQQVEKSKSKKLVVSSETSAKTKKQPVSQTAAKDDCRCQKLIVDAINKLAATGIANKTADDKQDKPQEESSPPAENKEQNIQVEKANGALSGFANGISNTLDKLDGFVFLGASVTALTSQMSGLSESTKSAINQAAAFASTFVGIGQAVFASVSQARQSFENIKETTNSLATVKKAESVASNASAVANTKEAVASEAAAVADQQQAVSSVAASKGGLLSRGASGLKDTRAIGSGFVIGLTVAISALQYFSAKASALADEAAASVQKGFENAKNGISVNTDAIKKSAKEEIELRNKSANLFSAATIGTAGSFALAGAATGAALGSIVPVVGTAAGAIGGSLVGAVLGAAAALGIVEYEVFGFGKAEREAREASISTIYDSIDSIVALNQAQNKLSEDLSRIEESKGFTPEERFSQRLEAVSGVSQKGRTEGAEATKELQEYASRFGSTVLDLAGATEEQIKAIVEATSGVDNVELEVSKIKFAAQQLSSSTDLIALAVRETRATFDLAIDSLDLNKPETIEAFNKAAEEAAKTLRDQANQDIQTSQLSVQEKAFALAGKSGEELEQAQRELTRAQDSHSDIVLKNQIALEKLEAEQKSIIKTAQAEKDAIERTTAAQIAQYNALQRANDFMDQLSARSADLDKQSKAIDNFAAVINNQISSFEVSSIRGLEDPTNVRDTQRFAQEIASATQNAGPEAQRQGRELARLSQISQRAQELIGADISRLPTGVTPEILLKNVGITRDSVGEDIFNKIEKDLTKVSGKVTPEILSGILSPLAEQTGAYAKNVQGIIDNQNKELQAYAKYLDAFDDIRRQELEGREKLNETLTRGTELRATARGQEVTIDRKQANRIFVAQSQLNAGARFRSGGVQLRAGDITGLKRERDRAKLELQRIQTEKNLAQTSKDRVKILQRLQKEEREYINTVNDATAELDRLANQSDRTSDILGEIGKEQAKRETLTKIIEEFVVGGTEERRAQVEAFAGIQNVLMTGTLQGQTAEQRSATVGLLDRLQDIIIPGTGGLTGKDVKQEVVFRDAIRMGLDPNIARQLATATSKEEKLIQALDRLTEQMESAARARADAPQINPVFPAKGGLISPVYKKGGGSIFSPKGTDTVPAMLTPGEFVVKKSAVDKVGAGALQAINNGVSPVYKDVGGSVPGFIDWIGTLLMDKMRKDRKVDYTRVNAEIKEREEKEEREQREQRETISIGASLMRKNRKDRNVDYTRLNEEKGKSEEFAKERQEKENAINYQKPIDSKPTPKPDSRTAFMETPQREYKRLYGELFKANSLGEYYEDRFTAFAGQSRKDYLQERLSYLEKTYGLDELNKDDSVELNDKERRKESYRRASLALAQEKRLNRDREEKSDRQSRLDSDQQKFEQKRFNKTILMTLGRYSVSDEAGFNAADAIFKNENPVQQALWEAKKLELEEEKRKKEEKKLFAPGGIFENEQSKNARITKENKGLEQKLSNEGVFTSPPKSFAEIPKEYRDAYDVRYISGKTNLTEEQAYQYYMDNIYAKTPTKFAEIPFDQQEKYYRNRDLMQTKATEEEAYSYYMKNRYKGSAPRSFEDIPVDFQERWRKNVDSGKTTMTKAEAYRYWMENYYGKAQYRANGGTIFKPKGTDTVPAMLTPGEFVIRKSAVDKVGVGTLQAINNGQGLSNGGVVYRQAGGMIPGGINLGNVGLGQQVNLIKSNQLKTALTEAIIAAGPAGFFRIADKNSLTPKDSKQRRAIASLIQSGKIRELEPIFGNELFRLVDSLESNLSSFTQLNASGVQIKGPIDQLAGKTPEQAASILKSYFSKQQLILSNTRPIITDKGANTALTLLEKYLGVNINSQIGRLFQAINSEQNAYADYFGIKPQDLTSISAQNIQNVNALIENIQNRQALGAGKAGGVGFMDDAKSANFKQLARDSTLFFKSGGRVPYFSSGGGVDSIPAMLTPGEFVMNADTVRKYGVEKMKQLNKGNIPGFNRGGSVGGEEGGSINPSAGGTLSLDTSRIQGVFDNFIGNFSPILDNITKVFSGVSDSLNKLAESFGGFTMQHTVTVDGLINLGGLNIDTIKNELSKSIGQMVADEVTKRMDDQSNKFSAG